jgi:hypothetical protein
VISSIAFSPTLEMPIATPALNFVQSPSLVGPIGESTKNEYTFVVAQHFGDEHKNPALTKARN